MMPRLTLKRFSVTKTSVYLLVIVMDTLHTRNFSWVIMIQTEHRMKLSFLQSMMVSQHRLGAVACSSLLQQQMGICENSTLQEPQKRGVVTVAVCNSPQFSVVPVENCFSISPFVVEAMMNKQPPQVCVVIPSWIAGRIISFCAPFVSLSPMKSFWYAVYPLLSLVSKLKFLSLRTF